LGFGPAPINQRTTRLRRRRAKCLAAARGIASGEFAFGFVAAGVQCAVRSMPTGDSLTPLASRTTTSAPSAFVVVRQDRGRGVEHACDHLCQLKRRGIGARCVSVTSAA